MKSNSSILNNKFQSENTTKLIEETIESRLIYDSGSYSFFSDKIKLPDGGVVDKNYVKYPEAVAIIPFINENEIILVEQYRYPIKLVTLEIPAGKIDNPNEARHEAALRELLEETGYRAESLEYLFSYFPCPGYSTEILHIHTAHGLIKETQCLDRDEFIYVKISKLDEVLNMIRKGEIVDSKTIISILYLQFRK